VKSIYNIKSSQGHPCPDAVGKSQTGASVLARNLWFYLYLSDIWLEEHWNGSNGIDGILAPACKYDTNCFICIYQI